MRYNMEEIYEKSLKLLNDFLDNTPEDELIKELEEVEKLNIESIPVDEYFNLFAGNFKFVEIAEDENDDCLFGEEITNIKLHEESPIIFNFKEDEKLSIHYSNITNNKGDLAA
ncbi:hypothetical protein FHQ18_00430 [Deferribacter autotrophicus]|uniref:Uncharacterized protein n=1 Tax=Deferribacter autotrophicus TaxID=500465 RepID=A0A5A8F5P8_9BACT|nr:hypothetical protein [Deferribacter autotrophicus]KAA0259377.1 hypothetical protein FHQ18_00430 [Deferribacter autotrophicus]